MRYLFFILLLSAATMYAQDQAPLSDAQFQYLVRQPRVASAHPPLLILMHGIGSNEADLFSFASQLPDSFLVISARAPYRLGQGSYAWYHATFGGATPTINAAEAEASRLGIIKLIGQMQDKYHTDPQRVYLCGFSQGAIISYSVGLTRPDLVHAMAIMSGRMLDEAKPLIKPSDQLKHLKIFISHGTQDNVLNINYAHEARAYLKQLGITPSYHEYKDTHTINSQMLTDMIGWLKTN